MRTKTSLEVRQVAVCLLIVAVASIVMSGVLAGHVLQVIPALVVFVLIPRWRIAGAWAAIGVLSVWFVIMAVIWAYLLGLSDIASGTYTTFEVFLTIVIAGCSAHGIQKAVQSARTGPLPPKIIALAGGLGAQASVLALGIELFG